MSITIRKTNTNNINNTTARKLKEADRAYHNFGNPIISDAEYDIIKDELIRIEPDHPYLKRVGFRPDGESVKLPIHMGSMDKVKPDGKSVYKFIDGADSIVITHKLDGVSGLIDFGDFDAKAYTRGDGTHGKEISHIFRYIKTPIVPESLKVRGEFIMRKSVFNTKYKDDYANPRNLVAGLLNAKYPKKELRDIEFIAYELMDDNVEFIDGLILLESLGFNVVEYAHVKTISELKLSTMYKEKRNTIDYEIDGLIITRNNEYKINREGNPSHSIAFKMPLEDQKAVTTVKNVEWNISKDGYMKPRIEFDVVSIGGVSIRFCTGFNAKFIMDNKIGVGTKIEIIRSGDVIPHIESVLIPTSALMPTSDWVWVTNSDGTTGVDIKTRNDTHEMKIKSNTRFFKKCGVDGIGEGIITKLYDGGLTTINLIVNAGIRTIRKIDGIGEKTANKIVHNITNTLSDIPADVLMSASGIFGRGFGDTSSKLIVDAIPRIMDLRASKEELYSYVIGIDGIGDSVANSFSEKFPSFVIFVMSLSKCTVAIRESTSEKLTVCDALDGKCIVVTGFRDAELIKTIEMCGGRISGSVSSKTDILLCRNIDSMSGKVKKAKILKDSGIKDILILTLKTFIALAPDDFTVFNSLSEL